MVHYYFYDKLGDNIGKLAVLEISEPGDKIGEKLLMLLNARQRQELIKYLLSAEKQNGGSADNLCILSETYGLQTEAGSVFTEIRMGDLYFCPEQRLVWVGGQVARILLPLRSCSIRNSFSAERSIF